MQSLNLFKINISSYVCCLIVRCGINSASRFISSNQVNESLDRDEIWTPIHGKALLNFEKLNSLFFHERVPNTTAVIPQLRD